MTEQQKHTICAFYLGKYYPLLAAAMVFLGHALGLEMIFLSLVLLSIVPACLLCDDFKFAVAPFLYMIFTVSARGYSPSDTGYAERYLNLPTLIVTGVSVAVTVAAIVIFAVRHWKSGNAFSRHGILEGLVIFCGAMMLNGLFSPNYTPMNLFFSGVIAAILLAVYVLFSRLVHFDGQSMGYLMYCLVIAGLLIAAELILAYLTTVQFEGGEIVKGSVVLGWGVWTTIGGMLAFLMPTCFYFAASHRRGWIGYLVGLFLYVCILLSQSRGALLFGSLGLALCMIYLCFKGKNRKQNRIFTLAIFLLGAVGCLLLADKLISLVQNFLQYGFGDNGRFEIWKIGMNHFLENPVFGSGFYDSYTTEEWERIIDPYLYHNTVVQLFGSMGLVGVLAYAYHRFCTVRLVWRCPTEGNIFLAIAILMLLLFSLLDVLFFKMYPSIFYAVMLAFMQRDGEPETDQ